MLRYEDLSVVSWRYDLVPLVNGEEGVRNYMDSDTRGVVFSLDWYEQDWLLMVIDAHTTSYYRYESERRKKFTIRSRVGGWWMEARAGCCGVYGGYRSS